MFNDFGAYNHIERLAPQTPQKVLFDCLHLKSPARMLSPGNFDTFTAQVNPRNIVPEV